jgi:hypothetical protein
MSFFFGDSFDCYALPADALLGYWDGGTTSGFTLGTGRFPGSRGLVNASNPTAWFFKSSGQNDNIHHISVAIQQTTTISGTTLYIYFQLSDGATNQCCIVFRSDGAILLTSATAAGTVLATYPSAITVINTWYQFEFEVVIHNTAGSFAVRKNGNTSNDFSATSLNTRPGTNAYANKLTVTEQQNSANTQVIDDLLWRSDTSTVPWVGDIRCYTRRPDTDAAAAWTRPGTFQMQPYFGTTVNSTMASSQPRYTLFTSQGGTISSVVVNFVAGYTGNLKCAIYNVASGTPGAVLQAATAAINNPVIGANTFTFSPAVSLAKGTQFFVAICSDATTGNLAFGNTAPYMTYGFTGTTAYASFPVASPTTTGVYNQSPVFPVVTSAANADLVSEPYEDAAASYVYSSAPGAQDLYTLTGISSTPNTIVGVTTRGLLTKSDAGTRLAAVQLRSGATTVQSAGALSNSAWGWLWRSDPTDPATGAAWTVSGVAAAQIGAQVTG